MISLRKMLIKCAINGDNKFEMILRYIFALKPPTQLLFSYSVVDNREFVQSESISGKKHTTYKFKKIDK